MSRALEITMAELGLKVRPADRPLTLPRNRPPYAVRFESASVVVLDRGYCTLAVIDIASPAVRKSLRAMLEDNGEHCHLDWDKRHGRRYAAQFGKLSALATSYPTKWRTRSEAFHQPVGQAACDARTARGTASSSDMAEWLSPTDIGKMLGAPPTVTNRMLCDMGFQTKRSGAWVLTEAGKRYGKAVTLELRSGMRVPQNRWLPSVVDAIRKRRPEVQS